MYNNEESALDFLTKKLLSVRPIVINDIEFNSLESAYNYITYAVISAQMQGYDVQKFTMERGKYKLEFSTKEQIKEVKEK
jgi:hypothetical protein